MTNPATELMMECRPIPLIFIVLLSVVVDSYGLLFSHAEQQDSIRFELLHRYDPQLTEQEHGEAWPKQPEVERILELARYDIIRYEIISLKRGHGVNTRRRDLAVTAEIPLSSAADFGTGQYFVQVKVGNPAQPFTLITDTGSDLTWVNCIRNCGSSCQSTPGIFLPNNSTSFHPIPCSSPMCKVGLAELFASKNCTLPGDPCAYEFSYAGGSSASGIFANDTVTVGLTDRKEMPLDNVLIGCTLSTKGEGFKASNGVLGLGYSNYSFATTATARFGGKFSYCLVDHLSPKNISNYLMFGGNTSERSVVGAMQQTKLLLGVIPPFYTVNISGISVGGVMMNISSDIWDANLGGGTILDSGTSLALLAGPAYDPVMEALGKSLLIYGKLPPDGGPFDFCFVPTNYNESLVPKLVFHFSDGALFEPPVKSYVIDTAPQKKCIGILPVDLPGTSVIGNIMQQNHLWEFDLVGGKVGFAPSSCT